MHDPHLKLYNKTCGSACANLVITKAISDLRKCTGWSVHLLLTCTMNTNVDVDDCWQGNIFSTGERRQGSSKCKLR